MVKLIEAETRLDAWIDAIELLLDQSPLLNLVLDVKRPGIGGANSIIDKFHESENEIPMHSVAETIFPAVEYCRRGLQGVLEFYPEKVYPRIKRHPSITWGTYAYRLVRRCNGEGGVINPLEDLIGKMKDEATKRGPKRSCYELGISESEYDLPFYWPTSDGKRRMGGPCLSHLSFKLLDRKVHLTAFYRSHAYRNKVPGNLLGLARLQSCVARETGQSLGSLVVHSSYAYLDGSKKRVRTLLRKLRKANGEKEAQSVLVH